MINPEILRENNTSMERQSFISAALRIPPPLQVGDKCC